MRRDDVRELRRAVGMAARVGQQAPLRVADVVKSSGPKVGYAETGDSMASGDVSVPLLSGSFFWGGKAPATEPTTAANVDEISVSKWQHVFITPGDWPAWQASTGYGSGDCVTYDNGSGLRRWTANSSLTSGSTFTPANWTDVEAASGWKLAYIPHSLAWGEAQADSNSGNSYTSLEVDLTHGTATLSPAAFDNPLQLEITTGDLVAVVFFGHTTGGHSGSSAPGWVISIADGGGGGGTDTDYRVASQSGQTADYLTNVLIDHPAPGGLAADEYPVDFVTAGANMYALVEVPAPSESPRLIAGQCTADVDVVTDASFTVDNVKDLASGTTPAGNQTVHDPLRSYKNNDTIVAAWDDGASEWVDITPTGYTRIRGTASGAITEGSSGTVTVTDRLEGTRNPGTSVTMYAAKQAYASSDEVLCVWNDTDERWEDDTDLNSGGSSSLAKIGITDGAITAKSGTTLGHGTVEIYDISGSGTSRTLTLSSDPDETWFNAASVAIADNTIVVAKPVSDGSGGTIMLVDWEECG